MKSLILFCTLLLFAGCITEKKAKEYAYNHKDKLAEWCKDCFPVRERIIKGDSVFTTDTLIQLDTSYLNVPCPDGTIVTVPCPACEKKTIRNIIRITDSIISVDSALLFFYKSQLQKYKSDNDLISERLKEEKEKSNNRLIWSIVLGGILIIFIILFFRVK